MKNFFHVLEFELNNYLKNKTYVLSTIIIAVLLIVGISLPSFVDLSGVIPSLSTEENSAEKVDEEDITAYAIYDKNSLVNMDYLESFYPNSQWKVVNSKDELEKLINEDEVESGYVVNSLNNYEYYIENKGLHDEGQYIFEEALKYMYREAAITEEGLDFSEIESIYNTPMESEINVLGKDSQQNYFYAYILLFIIYFFVILYGQMVATSVASEKSSRAMEVLVTSTSTNSLIFGKVIAATIAAIIQVAIMLGAAVATYKVNATAWNGLLDNFLAIPKDILITFVLFGIVGYLFYSFIYAALGALVSKTEDISKSIGSISMIFMIAFFIGMFGLFNADSPIVKVASFVPFTSPLTIITRVALGSISTLEIVISFAILIVSSVLIALGASKIYRMGTLRYGNPIKLTNAIKAIRKNEE